jgi:hypothetical protein
MIRYFPFIITIFFIANSPTSSKDFPAKSGRMVFMSGASLAFTGGERNSSYPINAHLDVSYGYFLLPNFALGAVGVANFINPHDDFRYDFGFGPQVLFFFGGGEYGDDSKGRLYPYLSLAILYRWYDWRIACPDCLIPPPPDDQSCVRYDFKQKGSAMRGTFGVAKMLSSSLGYEAKAAFQLRDVNGCGLIDLSIGFGFFSFIR